MLNGYTGTLVLALHLLPLVLCSFGEDGTKHNKKEARLWAVPPLLCPLCPALRLQQQCQ